ncbi:uncharacterized protein [Periplaneta americana]|uniref:uncharacterized protein isoform X2 n=1 Tax=Periplaneta americana TaxID=6978 RepID=UPI0037E8D1BC
MLLWRWLLCAGVKLPPRDIPPREVLRILARGDVNTFRIDWVYGTSATVLLHVFNVWEDDGHVLATHLRKAEEIAVSPEDQLSTSWMRAPSTKPTPAAVGTQNNNDYYDNASVVPT